MMDFAQDPSIESSSHLAHAPDTTSNPDGKTKLMLQLRHGYCQVRNLANDS
jgi:hypothetical protein